MQSKKVNLGYYKEEDLQLVVADYSWLLLRSMYICTCIRACAFTGHSQGHADIGFKSQILLFFMNLYNNYIYILYGICFLKTVPFTWSSCQSPALSPSAPPPAGTTCWAIPPCTVAAGRRGALRLRTQGGAHCHCYGPFSKAFRRHFFTKIRLRGFN